MSDTEKSETFLFEFQAKNKVTIVYYSLRRKGICPKYSCVLLISKEIVADLFFSPGETSNKQTRPLHNF